MIDRSQRLQSFSALVAFSPDWRLTRVSANCSEILGRDLTRHIGKDMDALFPSQTAHHLRSRAQVINHDTTAARVFALDPYDDGLLFDVTVHAHEAGFYFEFVQASAPNPVRDETALVLRLVRRIRRAVTQRDVISEAVRGFRMLSGFRHVTLLQPQTGQMARVIASDGGQPLDGVDCTPGAMVDLVYFAGRISTRSLLYLVADAKDPGTGLAPAEGDGTFREAISCAPLQEHQNWLLGAGMRASLTVLVPSDGKRGHVFVAHDNAPHFADQHRRSALELYAEFVADELTRISLQEKLARLSMPPPKPSAPVYAMEAQQPFLRLVTSAPELAKALVVDDDWLISLETAEMLRQTGAQNIDSVATQEEALDRLSEQSFDFAVLDVNLESGTSEDLAHELKRRAVPFVLLTGLEQSDPKLRPFPNAPLLQKPVDLPELRKAMTALGLPMKSGQKTHGGAP